MKHSIMLIYFDGSRVVLVVLQERGIWIPASLVGGHCPKHAWPQLIDFLQQSVRSFRLLFRFRPISPMYAIPQAHVILCTAGLLWLFVLSL